jgi:poly-gamma-glutamate synthesis protein (capsule biosynthesis protein)
MPARRYVLSDDPTSADARIGAAATDGRALATWVYALVAPFITTDDGLAWDDVRNAWAGAPSGPWAGRPLLMSEETLADLKSLLGEPAVGAVVAVPAAELLDRAWAERPAWAVVPFEALEPRWKVLRLDGASPLDRDLDLDAYPLVVRLSAAGPDEVLEPLLNAAHIPATNRDEGRMTVVVMTGVTALTRATAWRMEGKGLTYPAQDIAGWLQAADITHVSNEVAFDPECGTPNPVQEGVSFCSDPRYITLLEHIGVDVVEMTGNHIADAGVEHIGTTLDMYVERGWQYFGGGRNLEDARQAAIFEHNGNTIAFLGCNPAGPRSVWATEERAGAAPCDYGLLYAQLAELRAQGALPIVTLQYWEEDRYDPTPQQVGDFAALVEAGAVIVSGSHAHHVQGFGFHAGRFIHYGVGNLFFDQMDIMGNRQEFIDRHVFYAGRHVSTELLTALLEDWSRPRPMTAQERLELLQTVFAVSRWE